ncbi:hypothetical protein BD779DRAFT_1612474 [Infundibulicybe gibba]|nr:hypothetical protein BD779DRAFT_1612474 [Infundibulicybe gibba]
MADTKAAPANKIALSRALGAAFLNHQVQQLEKSVNNGPGSGNWRDRRPGAGAQTLPNGTNRPRAEGANRRRIDDSPPKGAGRDRHNYSNPSRDQGRRRSSDDTEDKDADIVVVDASVLVHALYQVKKWCRDGREEVVVVPLEALNTLDLLKKGTSPLAQRARAASRILEAQVGTNPRICVQRDDAFVLWDNIAFSNPPESAELAGKSVHASNTSPEWVRRTISCARWEVENVSRDNHNELKVERPANATNGHHKQLKVVLAVLSSQPSLSPRTIPAKLVDTSPETPLAPIPLPVSSFQHANKHELRSSGNLVAHWAARAGIQLLEVSPTAPAPTASAAGRVSEEDERNKGSHHPHGSGHSHGSRGRRLSHGTGNGRVGLVERPPAVKAMMEMVAQPTRVVRVLARGEKLDPDP